MYLIEILLPCKDNDGEPFPEKKFAAVRERLINQFGGLTAFARAPAQGVFKEGGEEAHDDIVVIEVMVKKLDRDFWAEYREHLEQEFAQDEIVIRASAIERL